MDVPGFNIASYDSDSSSGRTWPESSNLRLATWSPNGDPLKYPTAVSHLPGGSQYHAFNESVDTCLTDVAAPAPPAPCGNPTDNGTPQSKGLCSVMLAKFSGNACTQQSTWLAALEGSYAQYFDTTATSKLQDLIRLSCTATQTEDGSGNVSHVLGGTNYSDLTEIITDLTTILTEIGNNAYHANGSTTAAQGWANGVNNQGVVTFSACNPVTAALINGSGVISQQTGNNVPPVSAGTACSP